MPVSIKTYEYPCGVDSRVLIDDVADYLIERIEYEVDLKTARVHGVITRALSYEDPVPVWQSATGPQMIRLELKGPSGQHMSVVMEEVDFTTVSVDVGIDMMTLAVKYAFRARHAVVTQEILLAPKAIEEV